MNQTLSPGGFLWRSSGSLRVFPTSSKFDIISAVGLLLAGRIVVIHAYGTPSFPTSPNLPGISPTKKRRWLPVWYTNLCLLFLSQQLKPQHPSWPTKFRIMSINWNVKYIVSQHSMIFYVQYCTILCNLRNWHRVHSRFMHVLMKRVSAIWGWILRRGRQLSTPGTGVSWHYTP